jgi:hypothetical protein
MLSSAVEFRWDNNKNTGKPHESLGTKITNNTVLTHNHFSDLAGTYILDPINTRRPHGVSNSTRTMPFGWSRQYGAQTRLIFSAVKYAGQVAPIASQSSIEKLGPGDTVDVVYWDDDREALAVANFQIRIVQDHTVIVLNDPEDIINSGDSGGGVFLDGELIGNTWRYIKMADQNGKTVDKEVHVQIIPENLNRALRNW